MFRFPEDSRDASKVLSACEALADALLCALGGAGATTRTASHELHEDSASPFASPADIRIVAYKRGTASYTIWMQQLLDDSLQVVDESVWFHLRAGTHFVTATARSTTNDTLELKFERVSDAQQATITALLRTGLGLIECD